ncbi:hypothetical protein [Luminiphilus syltensis]|uniref:hypothetical protein n=1 Tax=Luminiphilus syltensis TaxID=1341119 RepID=UPI00058DC15E|nr:hypothetical protein [Luminiphilus syltensis]
MNRFTGFLYVGLIAMLVTGCASVGDGFKSDQETLSRLVVGETTPEEAIRLLGTDPYIRQNLPDGSLALHWQHISVVYVGVTDNRSLVLRFTRGSTDAPWRFEKVLSAQNIELPPDMPFGTLVQ